MENSTIQMEIIQYKEEFRQGLLGKFKIKKLHMTDLEYRDNMYVQRK